MISEVPIRFVALVRVFAICQVSGAMCTLPDLAVAEEGMWITEEGDPMVCVMEGGSMCPPSATTSPERQGKNGVAIDLDRGPILLSPAAVLTIPSVPTLWSWSRTYSILRISIDSSSVLRI
jgi:hypothetical protein